jgi:hypothetical protein
MISLGRWEKERKYNGNLIIVLKEWKWVVIVLGSWNFRKDFTNPLRFHSITSCWLSYKAYDLIVSCAL